MLGRTDISIRWGTEMDVRAMTGGPGEMSPAVVAAYVSKYSVKGAEGLGLPPEPIESDDDVERLDVPEHVRSLVRTAWELGWRHQLEALKLREHAHGLGFGGHFLTKSSRCSTTMGALRKARREFVRRQRQGKDGVVLDAWGRPEDEELAEVRSLWLYSGWGYHTAGEAYLASSAAARAREERRIAREELQCQAA